MDFLSKILNYERGVFEEYCDRRQQLLQNVDKIDFKTLDKKQKVVFIHHLKNIIDPVKSSTGEISNFLENTEFKDENSLNQSNQVNLVYLLYLYLSRGASDPEETEISESEVSEPEVSESEVSESEVSVSDSV
jgi:hypothetical protein